MSDKENSSNQSPPAKILKSSSPSSLPIATSTPKSTNKPTKEYIIKNKPQIHGFLSNILRTNMSNKVLVDIVINDDPEDNKITIVGRPPVYGSARQQMRHVTPYSFVEKAIKAKVLEMSSQDIMNPIQDLINNTLGVLSSIHSSGICLTENQYLELGKELNRDLSKEEQHFFDMKMETEKKDSKSTYYLIDNIEELELCRNSKVLSYENILQKAQDDYNTKFHKYINSGLQYLLARVQEDHNALMITCEAIARFILTIFNQEKGSSFTEEGNSLIEEVRLYNEPIAKLTQTTEGKKAKYQYKKIEYKEEIKYDTCLHKEIVEKIKQNKIKYLTNETQGEIYVRIVNNEGPLVQKAANALGILDKILSTIDYSDSTQIETLCAKYQPYNQPVKLSNVKLGDAEKYNIELSYDNFLQYFPYHVAKHLYSVFDFKPLEQEVLAPKQLGNTEIIKVYAIADKYDSKYLADYSIQNGDEYRKISANRVIGKSREVIRPQMSNQETKEILIQKAIVHTFIALLPFSSLLAKTLSNEETPLIKKIFQEFKYLIMEDYNTYSSKPTEKYLDEKWESEVEDKFNNTCQLISINDSSISIPTLLEEPSLGKIDLSLDL